MVAIGNGVGSVNGLEKIQLNSEQKYDIDFKIDGKIQGGLLPDLLSGGNEKLSPLEKRFDINRDGQLDKAEKKALAAYIKEKFDIDGNGEMDDFEKIAHNAYKEAKMFDFNKNGKLDPEEKAALDAYKKVQAQKGDKEPHKPPFGGIGVGIIGMIINDKQVENTTDKEKFEIAA